MGDDVEGDTMKNRRGNEEHERILKETIREYELKGFRVVDLEGKSPDAIAAKDGKILAIEVIGETYKRGKGWKKSYTVTQKEDIYYMFDEVVIRTFHRGNEPLH